MTSKRETWSRDTNSCLPFDVNVMLNLSSISSQTWDCDILGYKNPCGKSLISRAWSSRTNVILKPQTWRQGTNHVISRRSRFAGITEKIPSSVGYRVTEVLLWSIYWTDARQYGKNKLGSYRLTVGGFEPSLGFSKSPTPWLVSASSVFSSYLQIGYSKYTFKAFTRSKQNNRVKILKIQNYGSLIGWQTMTTAYFLFVSSSLSIRTLLPFRFPYL